jgi:hypothetical protein
MKRRLRVRIDDGQQTWTAADLHRQSDASDGDASAALAAALWKVADGLAGPRSSAALTRLHALLPDMTRLDLTEYGIPGIWRKEGDGWSPDPGPHVSSRRPAENPTSRSNRCHLTELKTAGLVTEVNGQSSKGGTYLRLTEARQCGLG